MDLEGDRARYEADRAKDIRLSAPNGIDAAMKAQRLDALLFPGVTARRWPRKPGYPTVIVPFGFVPNAPHAAVSVRLRCQAGAVRRQLHRHGLQRAAAHRVRVRVRAGSKAQNTAAGISIRAEGRAGRDAENHQRRGRAGRAVNRQRHGAIAYGVRRSPAGERRQRSRPPRQESTCWCLWAAVF